MLLRGTLTQKWVPALKIVTQSYNNTPIERLGWLKPNDINSEADSVLIDQAKIRNKITIEKEPTYSEQKLNQSQYSGQLKVSDYVYKQFDSKLFDKSFDVSVSKMASLMDYRKNYIF